LATNEGLNFMTRGFLLRRRPQYVACALLLTPMLSGQSAGLEPSAPAQANAGQEGTMLGVTHCGGLYYFTKDPYIVEGALAIQTAGFPAAKFWLTNLAHVYPHNSDWNLSPDASLVDMVSHPYLQRVLDLPFQTIALEVQEARWPGWVKKEGFAINPDSDFSEDERQMRELTAWLLRRYADEPRTFILQNWEGDWMFWSKDREAWRRGEHPDLAERSGAFVRWIDARQRGVEAGRRDVPESKARVLHAVEVNQVLAAKDGVPCLTTEVLPKVKPDLISWSCYDGMRLDRRNAEATIEGLNEGIDILQKYARTVEQMPGGAAVMIGEVGVPENVVPAEVTMQVLDASMQTFIRRGVPYVFYWQMFCNEREPGAERAALPEGAAPACRGFWLVRPDGTQSYAGAFFEKELVEAEKRRNQAR
jgi:hypothetical protein